MLLGNIGMSMSLTSQHRETDSRGKGQKELIQLLGHEPMLTTSENNYKRSPSSFQQSCINQIMTQSIGIHLKMKSDKENSKQISIQLKLERRH